MCSNKRFSIPAQFGLQHTESYSFQLELWAEEKTLISKYVFVAPRKFGFTQAEMLAVSASPESHTFWAHCELKEMLKS